VPATHSAEFCLVREENGRMSASPNPVNDPTFGSCLQARPQFACQFAGTERNTSTFGLATTGSITNPRFSSVLRLFSEASAEVRLCPSIELALSGAGKR
jgi:hypothetical protein